VDELFKLMSIIVSRPPDASEQELNEISQFKRNTLQLYMQVTLWRIACFSISYVVQVQSNGNPYCSNLDFGQSVELGNTYLFLPGPS
jgi:hypothetical protein